MTRTEWLMIGCAWLLVLIVNAAGLARWPW